MILTCKSSNPQKNLDFFIENYPNFSPIKKISVFFDCENFLLTNYSTDIDVNFVAENYSGEQIHLSGLNCGYSGESPSATAKLLIFLGMETAEADSLITAPGLEIPFSEDGSILFKQIKTSAFFCSINLPCVVSLNSYNYIDFDERKLYFINPQIQSFGELLNVIDRIQPYEIQHYIGKNSPLENSYRPPQHGKKGIGVQRLHFFKRKGIEGINLIIRGNQLSVLCLIDLDVCISVVNVIYYYLFGEPLRYEQGVFLSEKPNSGKKRISLVLEAVRYAFKGKSLHGSRKVNGRKF